MMSPRIFAFGLSNVAPSKLQDFQTIGSYFNEEDPFELLMIPKTFKGKKAKNVPGNLILYKNAMQDAFFAAELPLKADLAEEVYQGLLHPYWQIYLGRKAYVPSDLVARGIFANFAEAEKQIDLIRKQKGLNFLFKVVPASESNNNNLGELIELYDVPICFGAHKQYQSRNAIIIS